jgi:hypothetical protein
MNGFITKRMWLKAGLVACQGVLLAGVGCYEYKDVVDPCYPQRYNYMSEREVYGAIAPQVANGHMLDQTVWNYHFDAGTDRLNAMGLDHLAMLARRKPQADPLLFLQTAQSDVSYDPAAPERMAEQRQELNNKRIAAVRQFMTAQTAGKGYDFQVVVIDPSEIGLPAIPVNTMNQQYNSRFKGGLTGGGASASGGGGAAATSGAPK